MDKASLVDLGYNGNTFTWTNARDGMEIIRERLNRALANPEWLVKFPHTQVTHLTRTHSDHCPILVSLDQHAYSGSFPFRCKEAWLSHPNFDAFFVDNWKSPHNFMTGRQRFLSNVKHWIEIFLVI